MLLLLQSLIATAQDSLATKGVWDVTGGIQHESLFPTVDMSADRTFPRPDWAKIDHMSNSYLDLGVRYEHQQPNKIGFTGFATDIRGELMLSPLPGFEPDFRGYGLAHLHVNTDFTWGNIAIGDVYSQFGSGFILRLYEERSLGVDNSVRGARIVFKPVHGLYVEMLGGKQRRYWNAYTDGAWGWNYSRDALMGANLELYLDRWIRPLQEADATLLVGGSYVSKYEAFDTIYTWQNDRLNYYNLPRWVGAADVRAQFTMQGWNALVEYAYKANDPCRDNNYSYRPGHAILTSLSYSRKGLAILGQVKRSDNMAFRSERQRTGTAGFINHLPAFAFQHTYELPAMYPYATQTGGEWAFQGEIRYTWKRGTKMGGKYGTMLKLNASHIRGIQPSHWFVLSKEPYYTDVNLELNKKLTKDWYLAAMLMYQTYNQQVVEGHGEIMRAGIGVLDVKWATSKNVQMRAELQYMYSRQRDGQWIYALYELSLFKQLMLTLSELYCIGGGSSESTEQGKHYYTFLATWQHGAHRLSAGYRKTNDGFSCAGGVCRYVPAQEGVVLSYDFTW